jgi:hypothetical protein
VLELSRGFNSLFDVPRQLNGDKIVGRVEVILIGFVNDSDLRLLLGIRIRQLLVDLRSSNEASCLGIPRNGAAFNLLRQGPLFGIVSQTYIDL